MQIKLENILDFDSLLVFILQFSLPKWFETCEKKLILQIWKSMYLSKHLTAFYTMNMDKQAKPSSKPSFFNTVQCIEIFFGRTVWHTCLPAILNQPSNQPLTCLITRIYWSFPMNLRITTNSSQCQLKLPKEIFCNLPSIDLPSFTVRGPSPFLGLFISQLGKKKLHFVKTNGLYNKIS